MLFRSKPDHADLQLKETDVESLDFVRRAREAIIAWKDAVDLDMLEITTHTGLAKIPREQAITRFEKRLVCSSNLPCPHSGWYHAIAHTIIRFSVFLTNLRFTSLFVPNSLTW